MPLKCGQTVRGLQNISEFFSTEIKLYELLKIINFGRLSFYHETIPRATKLIISHSGDFNNRYILFLYLEITICDVTRDIKRKRLPCFPVSLSQLVISLGVLCLVGTTVVASPER